MDESVKFEPLGKGKTVAVSKNHTFTTDAILLSYFARAKKSDKLVDLGTGTGIIPFLMLRDNLLKTAVGVDISEEAATISTLSAQKNGFSNFTAICADINDLKGKIPFGETTLVTCNPPYKAAGAGIESRADKIRTARHEIFCTLSDIVNVSAKLLTFGGRLCLCQRPERMAELITLMSSAGIEPKRLRLVAKTVGAAPWLFLVEGKRSAHTGLTVEPTLYLYGKDGNLTEEMINIYGEYKKDFL